MIALSGKPWRHREAAECGSFSRKTRKVHAESQNSPAFGFSLQYDKTANDPGGQTYRPGRGP